jgi:hypothetical protein
MSVSSLRPERSASANSATSACQFLLAACILSQKGGMSMWKSSLLLFGGNKTILLFVNSATFAKLSLSFHYSTDRGVSFLRRNRYIVNQERSCAMFVLAVAVVILLLVLAGSDLLVSLFSPEELSNMGVQEQ